MSLFGRPPAPATNPAGKDTEVSDPPSDSISAVSFSSAADYLAVASWNNEVRIYDVNQQTGYTAGKAMYQHQGPVLDVCWNKEGKRVISGGADNAGRIYDLESGQSAQIAQHDAPIKSIRWIESPQGGIVVTGSWDKTLRYWDLRSPNPIATVALSERCYSMDVNYPLLVVATADRRIQSFNLANPTTPIRTQTSPLKFQTRIVTCFPSADGYAIGSVEGRLGIQPLKMFIKDTLKRRLQGKAQYSYNMYRTLNELYSQGYTFRCHRTDKNPNLKNESIIHAVNDVKFHPVHGTFSTAGSDGSICIWDKDQRTRLKTFETAPGPITSTAFNRDGKLLAYSVSYDWHKGHTGMTAGHPNKIMLHACVDEEVKKRAPRR